MKFIQTTNPLRIITLRVIKTIKKGMYLMFDDTTPVETTEEVTSPEAEAPEESPEETPAA